MTLAMKYHTFRTRHVQVTYALMSCKNNEECNLSVKKPFNVRSQIHSSSLSGLLFNVTNNKVKIKPSVIYQRARLVIFSFVQRWIFTDAVGLCHVLPGHSDASFAKKEG